MAEPTAAAQRPILYVDCFAGISGDMMLGALLDLGQATADAIHEALGAVSHLGFLLMEGEVERSGIRARTVRVGVTDEPDQPERSWAQIRAIIEGSALGEGVKARALAMFEALARAEGRVHGVAPEAVHFHEVGAVDSIVDVIGVAAGLAHVDAEVHAARVPLSGGGFVESRHGTLPLPAPATLALLEGVPVYGTDLHEELVTPTGAAILRSQVARFGALPPMRPTAIGWGAGTRDRPGRPGLLRLVLGEPPLEAREAACVVIEANVDDMTGELAGHAIERALAAGALDAWAAPITMKKGRPALQLGVLALRADLEKLGALVLRETTSIGLRFTEVGRLELPRRVVVVETAYGPIPVKLSGGGAAGVPTNVAPEFDACREAALRADVPLKLVIAAAAAAALGRT
jgi:uncharacterized protein (TIGR00299 family) protein